MGSIYIESIYGVHTRQPLVQISVTDDQEHTASVQMEPEVAMDQARILVEASVSALTDGFIVEFICQKLGLEPIAAGGILGDFRVWRDERQRQFKEHLRETEG